MDYPTFKPQERAIVNIVPGSDIDAKYNGVEVVVLGVFADEKTKGSRKRRKGVGPVYGVSTPGPRARSFTVYASELLPIRAQGHDVKAPSHGAPAGSGVLKLPAQRITFLYHVGTLDPAQAGQRRGLEANALSVSHAPEAWTQIAKLGGYPTWELTKNDGGLFLVATSLKKTEKAHLLTLAQEAGYIEPIQMWRYPCPSPDEDDEGYSYSYADTREEAIEEADSCEYPRRLVKAVDTFKTTAKLDAFLETKPEAGFMAESFAIIAMAKLLGYDGIWWHEDHEPDAYSAPRGGLFSLTGWRRKNLGAIEVCEYMMDYEAMSKAAEEFPIRRLPIPSAGF